MCTRLLAATLLGAAFATTSAFRLKRDFMYVPEVNSTDAGCFQRCNAKFQHDFEYSFNISSTAFYDFPFHPLVLGYNTFLLYCKLAEQRTKCYVEQCQDNTADTVFSPSNFICSFKRSHFTEIRECLAESEPITFLKCDNNCHDEVVRKNKEHSATLMNQVFSSADISRYENELGMLCSFQECYLQCMIPVVQEWHANDIYDWHAIAGHMEEFPDSCRRLSGTEPDPFIHFFMVQEVNTFQRQHYGPPC
ncbi:unnamed protein product [Nippostrongylus brasiliensis]|uniref:Chondroitin proteoglycan 4 domain-containing protein n=1 Tax=Nippostrongylus brasiliensis TaxID=27835 RepID=A0A0N4XZG4_NIPBR|nr:unnamed protein product [Nippostrongylus brasiliensis]